MDNVENVKKTVTDWFNGLVIDFYDASVQKLVTKCLNLHMDYAEKSFKVCSNKVK
jgi:hypothetical protein